MSNITLETIHQDLNELKKEFYELKIVLVQEPELSEDTVRRINEARQRMKTDFVSHEEMMKEFVNG